MKDKLIEALIELLKPNTIFALIIYGIFAWLSLTGKIEPNMVENAFLIVLSFYFGKKTAEQNGGK